VTLNLDFKVAEFIDSPSVFCAQLTLDMFAIAKFLIYYCTEPDTSGERCVMSMDQAKA